LAGVLSANKHDAHQETPSHRLPISVYRGYRSLSHFLIHFNHILPLSPIASFTPSSPEHNSTFILPSTPSMSKQKEDTSILFQIKLIKAAMKKAGVWSSRTPTWAISYNGESVANFWEWLQFIYIPMRMNGDSCPPHLLAPMLARHVEDDSELKNILTLVIELDNLSPSIENKISTP
jgi:hypothetical protein